MPRIRNIQAVTIEEVPWQRYLSAVPRGDLDLRVGILDPGEIAFYATVNEFGGGNVPERSFIRAAFDANRDKYERQLLRGIRAMEKGTPLESTVEAIGVTQVGDIKKRITKLRTPPNRPSTIARKGSSNPLIDTGTMRNTIEFEVVK